jgi:hypothetical protein
MIANDGDLPSSSRFLFWHSGFASHDYPTIRVTLDEVVGKIRELRKRVRLLCFWASYLLVGHSYVGILSRRRCTFSDRA